MFVEVKVVGSASEVVSHEFTPSASTTTLRKVLAELVAAEIGSYEDRRQSRRLMQVLTERDIAAGVQTGRIVSGASPTPAAPDVEYAVERALEAFSDGLVLVLLDGGQLHDLDESITVGSLSRLRLVRLVALAGG